MSTAEENLDFFIKSVAAIREDQPAMNNKVADNQRNLNDHFRKLEKDIVAAQEDATERAIKRARREQRLEFKGAGGFMKPCKSQLTKLHADYW